MEMSEEDGELTPRRNFDNGVSLVFRGDEDWFLDFAAPEQAAPTPGVYEGATQFPFQDPAQPGISVFGRGQSCTDITGRFVVLEAVYGPSGRVLRFAADFEQTCGGSTGVLRGAVRYRSTISSVRTSAVLLLDRENFTTGDPFDVSILANNLGDEVQADIHLGVRLPGGRPLSLVGRDLDVVIGTFEDPRTLVPLLADVDLSVPFTVHRDPFLSLQWSGREPRGSYELFLWIVVSGALDDGSIDQGDILAMATRPFRFDP